MRPLVLRVGGVVTEGVRTVGALERPFTCVDPHVRRQTGPLDEVLVTLLALIATTRLGGVTPQVSAESRLTAERLSTLVTHAT